jgi:hypothetical protein
MLYSALFMEIVSQQERELAARLSPHRLEAMRQQRRSRGGLRHAVATALVRAGTFVDASAGSRPARLVQ